MRWLLQIVTVTAAMLSALTVSAGELPTPSEGVLYGVAGGVATDRFEPEHTRVDATLFGSAAHVTVTQRFTNGSRRAIDAIYVFPLPHQSVVSSLTVTMGGRQLSGRVTSREAAVEAYVSARKQGRAVALVEEERRNVFTQSLAEVPPGATVVVELGYDVELSRRGDGFEFVYPMVVGPRFVPGVPVDGLSSGGGTAPDTDLVPDGSRVTPPVRRPTTRTRHAIEVNLVLSPGGELESIGSPTHKIETKALRDGQWQIGLADGTTVPNRDLVVRYRLAGDNARGYVQSGTWLGRGHGEVVIVAPNRPAVRRPLDLVIVVDGSSSMRGLATTQAVALVKQVALDLKGDDRLAVMVTARSNSDHEVVFADSDTTAAEMIAKLSSGDQGNDDLLAVLDRLMTRPPIDGRSSAVLLVTDGWNAAEDVLASRIAAAGTKRPRVYTVGVGAAPNRHLLEVVAAAGRGVDDVYVPEEKLAAVVNRVGAALAGPVLSDLSVSWRGMEVAELVPLRVRELHAGQAQVLRFRYRGEPTGIARITGRVGEAGSVIELPVVTSKVENASLARLWARGRLASAGDGAGPGGRHITKSGMTKLAIEYGVLSPYTAMIAIDAANSNAALASPGAVIFVPVEQPLGSEYDGIAGDTGVDAEPARTLDDREEAISMGTGRAGEGTLSVALSVGAGFVQADDARFAQRLSARISAAGSGRIAIGAELGGVYIVGGGSFARLGPVASLRLGGPLWLRAGAAIAFQQGGDAALTPSLALDLAVPGLRLPAVVPMIDLRWERPLGADNIWSAGLTLRF